MRSIFTKIFLWFLATLLFAIAALIVTAMWNNRARRPDEPFARMLAFECDEAGSAYRSGGKEALAGYLASLDRHFPGEHHFLDARGRDLVTGEDRAGLVSKVLPPTWIPRKHSPVHAEACDGGQHRLLANMPPRADSTLSTLDYGWILVTVALLCWVLAVQLASPLRRLKETVDCFGRGDLSARINSRRKDEIGDVSRAFDRMADRIETLLRAERRLLQDVSHELRSPLARLGFAVELARKGPDRDAALRQIKKDVERLGELVGELLEVTRAEGDPATRERDEIDLPGLVHSLVEECSLEAEARQVRLPVHNGQPLMVLGDRELLRRAIENVLRNALRYAPDETSVEVAVGREGNHALVAVRDFGRGVPAAQIDQIFQPFFRVDTARDAASGGVGLGLAITRRAVELHRGQVRAENANPGLRVTVELPLAAR
ncbi:MAG: sensor histidine kinase [Bryobacteraceae bacterium]